MGLLDLTAPRVAVISVGDDNPFGHPTPETLEALAGHDVETMRTDLAGDITIDVSRGGWNVRGSNRIAPMNDEPLESSLRHPRVLRLRIA